MALTKTIEVPKIEVVNNWTIQVATDTVIKEDGVELSRSRHRHSLEPFFSRKKSDGKWEHTATDISKETAAVQAIATAAWTEDIKTAYKAYRESQEN